LPKNKKNKIYFTECCPVSTRQRRRCRVPVLEHSAKFVQHIFAECSTTSTRPRCLCRVPTIRHSAKASLPSARDPALGKVYFKIFKKSLSSARDRALGKECNLTARQPSLLSFSPFTSLFYPSPLSPPPATAASSSLPARRRRRTASPRAPPPRPDVTAPPQPRPAVAATAGRAHRQAPPPRPPPAAPTAVSPPPLPTQRRPVFYPGPSPTNLVSIISFGFSDFREFN
jgi:hypothetical protein